MSKLQLYITKSLRGFKSLVNFNPSEDTTRYICDVRDALQTIEYDPSEKNIFYMLRYEADGVMMVVLRTIPDKPLDHLAAWIFIPNGMQISGEELEEVVRFTTRKVSNSGVSESDVADLRQLFAREYPVEHDAPSIVGMHGSEYAFSIYGDAGHTLRDYLGERMFQPSFVSYKGVLLLEGGLGIQGKGVDVTNEALAETTALFPPEASDSNFTPYIYDVPFTRPYRVALGRDIAISWRRQGFDPQEQVITVDVPNMRPEPIETDEARKTITAASFLVTAQSSKEVIPECVIKVNGTEITSAHTFTQSELSQAHVWIAAEGYFPFSGKIDLASSTQALIQMQERSKVYRFELPLKSIELGGPIEFEVRSKKELKDSPVDGYELLDSIQEGVARTNHLGLVARQSSMWMKGIYMAIGLAAGIILMIVINKFGIRSDSILTEETTSVEVAQTTPATNTSTSSEGQQKTETTTPPTLATPVGTPSATDTSDTAALAYLDSTKKWDRTEMERYPLLRGLWDDINTYNFKAIHDNWSKKLASSSNFKSVIAAAKQSVNKKVKLDRKAAHTPQYNKADDTVIGIVGWTYYVDP